MIKIPYKQKFPWFTDFIQQKLHNSLLNAIYNHYHYQPNVINQNNNYDLTVASYNVHKCIGVDKIFNPTRIVRVIAELQVDILALQEADRRFGERIGLINLQLLKSETGLFPVPLNTMSPHGHGWHGNALFLRKGYVYDTLQVTLPGLEPRGAVIVELEMATGPIRIIAAHFGLLRYSRKQQTKMLLAILQKRSLMPTLLIGDFNEWRMGKSSSLNHFSPYFDNTLEIVPSFPSRLPFLALDRVFAFPHQLVTRIENHHSPLARIASDHLPIKAYLNLANAMSALKNK
ncbi:endonuclease/exonuclease/phosphatase family metal-dependent hydrolase [Bartonella fuyuanensis]|uniref:Endonuclease/exonuclease/phosphatase family metal-dependent hydrolase n=1 Tax=Bartonella fuyuanensis TaxID=1460968 RepID=A0A840E287_9HYPH|nr:endonuclease/exonuclease/phosphatase family protein [Bartonella fuyuanensis]MBB4075889.1 endonuclease/exonuclease/phosphatase family metal-dependent hydrolase [Bartonella fuyuanensis]